MNEWVRIKKKNQGNIFQTLNSLLSLSLSVFLPPFAKHNQDNNYTDINDFNISYV